MSGSISEIERRTVKKVAWRLLPLIVVIYFVAYIDRTNVGFAAFGMTRDLGLTAYVYGWGAGIFFLGYFLSEVPSNLLLEKVGARRWIARIMVTWGIMAAMMAFVQGATSFLVLRFLLGVAEAGFFPGVIFYFTYWFPKSYRGRVIAALFLAVPGSNAVTAVISGALLGLDGTFGIPGWKWLYIVEAAPAVLLAFAALRYLNERPEIAGWLQPDKKAWFIATLEGERKGIVAKGGGHTGLASVLADRRVLSLAAIYFTIVMATYGITFFLPQIVKGLGGSDMRTGLLTAAPCPRNPRDVGLEPVLGPDAGAQVALHRGMPAGRRGPGSFGRHGQHVRGAGCRRDRHGRHLRQQALVLADAERVPDRHGGRWRHRHDQLHRQPGRLRRSLHGRLDQGRHRWLCGRALLPGRHRGRVCDDRGGDDPVA